MLAVADPGVGRRSDLFLNAVASGTVGEEQGIPWAGVRIGNAVHLAGHRPIDVLDAFSAIVGQLAQRVVAVVAARIQVCGMAQVRCCCRRGVGVHRSHDIPLGGIVRLVGVVVVQLIEPVAEGIGGRKGCFRGLQRFGACGGRSGPE